MIAVVKKFSQRTGWIVLSCLSSLLFLTRRTSSTVSSFQMMVPPIPFVRPSRPYHPSHQPFPLQSQEEFKHCCVWNRKRILRLNQQKNPQEEDDNEDTINQEGISLAADFFQVLQSRKIELTSNDLLSEEDEDDDEEEEEVEETTSSISSQDNRIKNPNDVMNPNTDDEEEEDEEDETMDINIPQSAINVMRGYDSEGAGKLAGDTTLTDKQVYDELKERVLESAGAFIELVGSSSSENDMSVSNSNEIEDEDDDEDEDESDITEVPPPKIYKSPDIVPDSGLTAGEVVTTVLDALLHNDIPYPNRGIEVLFGYSSPTSAVSQAIYSQGMTPEEYGEFLKDEDGEYKVLFQHDGDVMIDKGDYSLDKKKAFFTARLKVGSSPLDSTSVNFILASEGNEEDDCWLIESMLIRPEGMRRRRRR